MLSNALDSKEYTKKIRRIRTIITIRKIWKEHDAVQTESEFTELADCNQ